MEFEQLERIRSQREMASDLLTTVMRQTTGPQEGLEVIFEMLLTALVLLDAEEYKLLGLDDDVPRVMARQICKALIMEWGITLEEIEATEVEMVSMNGNPVV
jgi:hypothetical protein